MSRPRKKYVLIKPYVWLPCEIKRCLDDEDINENDDEASQPYNYHIPVSALKHVQH